jgi:translation initiation factor eIF-2B subunit beta
VVEAFKVTEVSELIERVRQVGQRLIAAQPRELAIGNIVRRVLGVIREEAEEDREGETSGYSDVGKDSRPQTPRETTPRLSDSPSLSFRSITSSPPMQNGTDHSTAGPKGGVQRPSLLTSHASSTAANAGYTAQSMFSLLSHPSSSIASPTATPSSQCAGSHPPLSHQAFVSPSAAKDLKAEVVEGIQEILEELNQADEQIASYALEHIHSNEIILTHSSSITVQKFLLKAAAKRKFAVVHAEAYPNDHEATHAAVVGKGKGEFDDDLGSELFAKTLTSAGITVILIPDSAVFGLMSRINKVVLGAHAVLANGSFVAIAGAKAIAQAAHVHSTHVVVLSPVYQLSPVYPFDPDTLMENGDPSKVVGYDNGDLVEGIEIENPLFDYVPAELVDLYITNL